MTGMGGGSLMTPMLILVFGFKPTVAIGTDILHGAIFKSFGAARHRQLGHVHARLAMWMLIGSAPASLLGVALSSWLSRPLRRRVRERRRSRCSGSRSSSAASASSIKAFLRPRGNNAPFLLQRRDKVIARPDRDLRRLHRRPHLGRLGHVLRARDDDRLPADRREDRRHRPLPGGTARSGWRASATSSPAASTSRATGWLLIGSIPGVLIGSQLTVKLPTARSGCALRSCSRSPGIKLLDPPGANAIILTVVAVALVVGISLADQELHPPGDRCGVDGRGRGGQARSRCELAARAAGRAACAGRGRPTGSTEVVTFYRDGLGPQGARPLRGPLAATTASCSALPGSDYHLEFTSHADGSPCPAPSVDNLLVLYLESGAGGGDRRRPPLRPRLSRRRAREPVLGRPQHHGRRPGRLARRPRLGPRRGVSRSRRRRAAAAAGTRRSGVPSVRRRACKRCSRRRSPSRAASSASAATMPAEHGAERRPAARGRRPRRR